jgi:hypothetical protein
MAPTAADAITVALSPETVLAQMRANGVTDIVWLPDSETKRLAPLALPRVGNPRSSQKANFRYIRA